MRVSLSSMPAQNETRVVDFGALSGGLNLSELPYRLPLNQSPEMKNLWWADGLLQCRDGQRYIADTPFGTVYAMYHEPAFGKVFAHIGSYICVLDTEDEEPAWKPIAAPMISHNGGTFFKYQSVSLPAQDALYYKNNGSYIQITRSDVAGGNGFIGSRVEEIAYTPTIILNANPDTGSGDMYQPENRLSARKRVIYNAGYTEKELTKIGDGTKDSFYLPYTLEDGGLRGAKAVYIDGTLVDEEDYHLAIGTGKLKFYGEPPGDGATILVVAEIACVDYHLPVKQIDSVDSVKVNGVELDASEYTVNPRQGIVTFYNAPPVTVPPTNNTVEIVYAKANAEAADSIMSCAYAATYGAGRGLVIVLGGCEAAPNAFFWGGNTDVGMDASYWPMTNYNYTGRSEEAITGFGKQYSQLIVFNERSVGKADMETVDLDGRDTISFTYQNINDEIGCDMPNSIQLIENNLVWCNKKTGAYMLRDSSAANENNVISISGKVNGDMDERPYLLYDAEHAERVCSFDDGQRYWLCLDGTVYLWDYAISGYKDPSWFYLTDIPAVAFYRDGQKTYHIDRNGRFTVFERTYKDYDGSIDKVYQFPAQNFGTYDRLKDIWYIILSVRSDTSSDIKLTYQCDYGDWHELMNIRTMNWKLVPRDLSFRSLQVKRYDAPAKRKPGLKHVHHFGLRLENNDPGKDLTVVSAQIYWRFSGKMR